MNPTTKTCETCYQTCFWPRHRWLGLWSSCACMRKIFLTLLRVDSLICYAACSNMHVLEWKCISILHLIATGTVKAVVCLSVSMFMTVLECLHCSLAPLTPFIFTQLSRPRTWHVTAASDRKSRMSNPAKTSSSSSLSHTAALTQSLTYWMLTYVCVYMWVLVNIFVSASSSSPWRLPNIRIVSLWANSCCQSSVGSWKGAFAVGFLYPAQWDSKVSCWEFVCCQCCIVISTVPVEKNLHEMLSPTLPDPNLHHSIHNIASLFK